MREKSKKNGQGSRWVKVIYVEPRPTKKRHALIQQLVSNPLRLEILRVIANRPASGKEIAADLEAKPASVHHHLRLLDEHRLLLQTGEQVGSGRGRPARRYVLRELAGLRAAIDGKPSPS